MHQSGRRGGTRGLRRAWPWLVVSAAVVVLVVRLSTGPELLDVPAPPARPALVGTLDAQPARPGPGDTVTLRARLTADRPATLSRLAVMVQRPDGSTGSVELAPAGHPLGPGTQELVGYLKTGGPGDYEYWLEYQFDPALEPAVMQPAATLSVAPKARTG